MSDVSDPSTSSNRDPVERLAEEFIKRRRNGDAISVTQYAEEYPEWDGRIRELFPMLLLLEEMKSDPSQAPLTPPGIGAGRAALAPERLGDYRIVREIGRGGMGVVYEAEQESLSRRVALKILPSSCLGSPTRVRRFLREARAAARLHHTNIVPIFGIGQQDDVYYYVMQLIPGHGLDQLISTPTLDTTTLWSHPGGQRNLLTRPLREESATGQDGTSDAALPDSGAAGPAAPGTSAAATADAPPVPPEGNADAPGNGQARGIQYARTIAHIGVQVAEALDYAHQHGILHRDIKPSNLLLDTQGTVWVSDFGLAKIGEQDDLTRSGDTIGTLRYMAPEQFAGRADVRSDIYSLGLTLYELLALRPAFDQQDRGRLIHQITQEEPPPLRRHSPDVPRDLETIVSKAIAPHPEQRYPTAADLAEDLRCYLEDRPIRARPIGPLGRAWRWCRRNPAVASLAGTAILLLWTVAIVATVGYLRTDRALQRASAERQLAVAARKQAESQRVRAEAEHERAEANLRLATGAFEEIFGRISARPAASLDSPEEESALPAAGWETAFTDRDVALLESLLSFYDQFAQRNQGDLRLGRESAEAYRRVGDIQRRLGQYEKALSAYEHAEQIYQRLATSDPAARGPLTAIAAIRNERGSIYRQIGRWSEAHEAHHQALAALEEHSKSKPSSPESRYELARTYSFLSFSMPGPGTGPGPEKAVGGGRRGRHFPFTANREGAENHRQALEILEGLVAESPQNDRYRLALARVHRDGYRLAAFAGRTDEAAQSRQQAMQLLEQLVTDVPANPDYRYELAETCATFYRRGRDTLMDDDARQQLQRAVEIQRELVAEFPGIPEYRAALARATGRLAEDALVRGETATAAENLQKSVDLQRALVREFPSLLGYRFFLGRSLEQLAELELGRGKAPAARLAMEEAIANSQKIQETTTRGPMAHMFLGRQYAFLSRILQECGESKLAAEAATKATELGVPPGTERQPRHFHPPAGKAKE